MLELRLGKRNFIILVHASYNHVYSISLQNIKVLKEDTCMKQFNVILLYNLWISPWPVFFFSREAAFKCEEEKISRHMYIDDVLSINDTR